METNAYHRRGVVWEMDQSSRAHGFLKCFFLIDDMAQVPGCISTNWVGISSAIGLGSSWMILENFYEICLKK